MSNANRSEGSKSAHGKSAVVVDHTHYPFWFGGSASCFAACVTHPLDLVKVRLQTRNAGTPKSMIGMFGHVYTNNGVLGLYKGLSAALLRQLTYSTARFGVYEELKSRFFDGGGSDDHDSPAPAPPSFGALVAMASASGFVGGVVGNAADVLNVRMQHDAALPVAQRRNYRGAADGLTRMLREEGARSLLRGVGPNSARAVLMTASQLATYDAFKAALAAHSPLREEDLATHLAASVLAGFVATTVCSPVDVVKTRVMSAAAGRPVAETLREVFRSEGAGVAWMFRGWLPSFIRLGPHTICTFLFLEQHKKIYRHLKGLDHPETTT